MLSAFRTGVGSIFGRAIHEPLNGIPPAVNQRPPSAWERLLAKLPGQSRNARSSTLGALSDEELRKLAADLGFMLRHQLKACMSTHEVLGDVVDAFLSRHGLAPHRDD